MTLSEALWKQNYFWQDKVLDILPRTKYLDKIVPPLLQNKDVLVLTGPRRVGKTYLMFNFIQDLIGKYNVPKDRILYCILNDLDLNNASLSDIVEEFRKIHRISFDEKIYVFFDEVQYVPKWDQQVANFFDIQNIKVIVSGSSSVLIKNQSTFLTGRQLVYHIYPLNFIEFLEFNKYKVKPTENYLYVSYLMEFLEKGGFPQYILENNPQYLMDLLDAVIFKDIVSIYRLKHPRLLKDILIWLAVNLKQVISYSKLTKALGQKSDNTVKQYVEYLKEIYQIMECRRYSDSLNEQMTSPKKYYFSDLGIRNNLIGGFRDEGAVAENVLFLHLCEKYKQENVFYFYSNALEVDFIVKQGLNLHIFESKFTDNISLDDKRLKGLKYAISELDSRKIKSINIITKYLDKEEVFENHKIEYIPLYKLLLKDK